MLVKDLPKEIREQRCSCGSVLFFRSRRGSIFVFCPGCERQGCIHPPGEMCKHKKARGGHTKHIVIGPSGCSSHRKGAACKKSALTPPGIPG